MVKKFVFSLQGYYQSFTSSDNKYTLLKMIDTIYKELTVNKNNITTHHKSRKWDKYKKMTNDYELVFTSVQGCPSIASYNSISRSYFKLWEMLHDFKSDIFFPSVVPLKAVFLADAPGGFIEAFINYRKQECHMSLGMDELFGMSLKPTNKIVPNWKIDDAFCVKNNLNLFYGSSGTGNMYNIDNIDELVETVGNQSVNFITADGGFDFSGDFNSQEEMSLRLIISEIYTAIRLQTHGGTFILKIFDIRSQATMKLLYILKVHYEKIFFVKPLTSRPANSEKYVVCTNFNMFNIDKILLDTLRDNVINYSPKHVLKNLDLPDKFILDLVHYNRVYSLHQIGYIMKTISLIDKLTEKEQKELVKHQVTKAVKWCAKYKIPISIQSLQKYKNYFVSGVGVGSMESTVGLT